MYAPIVDKTLPNGWENARRADNGTPTYKAYLKVLGEKKWNLFC